MKRFVLLIAFACGVLIASGVGAQTIGMTDPDAARIAHKVSYEIYSPFCPGKTLAMCPSANAAEVRRDIQDMAEAGMSEDQIKQSILDEYGEEFRTVEPGVMDNVGPLGLLGGGLLIAIAVVYFISRRRAGADKGDEDEAGSEAHVSGSAGAPPTDDDGGDPYTSALRDEYRD